jgi:hypothetical protein
MMTEQAPPAIGTQYPLLFTYRDTLFGKGFLVEVQATNGRALCVRESDDDYWVYGINPGGMAAHGADPDAAHQSFRRTFSHILVDLANSSASFDEFQASVHRFFEDTNEGYEVDWRNAIQGVQRGDVSLEGIPTVPANSPRTITVSIKQVAEVTPQDNSANVQYLLAA